MLSNIDKTILNEYSDEDLSSLYKKVITTYIIETYLKKSKENNIEVFPKDIFGSNKIDSIEEHIINFTGSKNDSLLDNILISEKTKFDFLNLVDKRNEGFIKWVEILQNNIHYQTELNYDQAESFLNGLKNAMLTIQKHVELLSSLTQHERIYIFNEANKMLCYSLAESLIYQLNFTNNNTAVQEPSIHLHGFNSDDSAIILLLDKNKEILEDKKENSLSNKLFGKEEPTSEEHFEYGLKKLLVMYSSQLIQILNNNANIQYQKNKSKESLEKISTYIDGIAKLQESKILKLFNNEEIDSIIEKEKSIIRQLIIKNISYYNQKITVGEIKELGTYF